jgi:hypothetical protein
MGVLSDTAIRDVLDRAVASLAAGGVVGVENGTVGVGRGTVFG